jgi:glucosamine--fructose-6-phosphate aminotransferase (isomerizing)
MTAGPATRSAYLADVLDQPSRLRALLASKSWEAMATRRSGCDRIVLTGMGASLHALLPAWLKIVAAGGAAWLIETAELLHGAHGLITDKTLVIAASQSGRSAEIVALADGRRVPGQLVALTNDRASPLAAGADVVVAIESGEEKAVSTRSYVNTVVAASLAADVLTGRPAVDDVFRQAADAIDEYLLDWRERIDRLTDDVGLPQRLFLLARGASLAAAGCGALIIKEAAKHQAEAMSSGQFRHGPLELADPSTTTVVLVGDAEPDRERNLRLAADIGRYGGRVVLADTPRAPDAGAPQTPALPLADVHGAGRAIGEIVALQLLSVSLAEQAGIEPGVFRHLEKVTTVE